MIEVRATLGKGNTGIGIRVDFPMSGLSSTSFKHHGIQSFDRTEMELVLFWSSWQGLSKKVWWRSLLGRGPEIWASEKRSIWSSLLVKSQRSWNNKFWLHRDEIGLVLKLLARAFQRGMMKVTARSGTEDTDIGIRLRPSDPFVLQNWSSDRLSRRFLTFFPAKKLGHN